MKQQLRKPENWQDFEELCQNLWGEIWRCPEIKRNGRSGQKQAGVDVYGVPQGEQEYFGIQCKGKDDYTNAQLSAKEIDAEIEKAENFKPGLKKLYFASTANKDAFIEEYVRLKDLDSRKQGLFEIHLFCWEDIVNLIDRYQRTHDWYVKKVQFLSHYSASICLTDDLEGLETSPKYFKTYISYKLQGKFEPMFQTEHALIIGMPEDYTRQYNEYKTRALSPQPQHLKPGIVYHNQSSIQFGFQLENTGDKVLEDFKLEFSIHGQVLVEVVNKQKSPIDLNSYSYDIWLTKPLTGSFKPKNKVLIQGDKLKSDLLCIRSTTERHQQVRVNWSLLCRDFRDVGVIAFDVAPVIESRQKSFNFYTEIPTDDTLTYDSVLDAHYRLENDIVKTKT